TYAQKLGLIGHEHKIRELFEQKEGFSGLRFIPSPQEVDAKQADIFLAVELVLTYEDLETHHLKDCLPVAISDICGQGEEKAARWFVRKRANIVDSARDEHGYYLILEPNLRDACRVLREGRNGFNIYRVLSKDMIIATHYKGYIRMWPKDSSRLSWHAEAVLCGNVKYDFRLLKLNIDSFIPAQASIGVDDSDDIVWFKQGPDGPIRQEILRRVVEKHYKEQPIDGEEAVAVAKDIVEDVFENQTPPQAIYPGDAEHSDFVYAEVDKVYRRLHDEPAPAALRIAGLAHDIERAFDDIRVKVDTKNSARFFEPKKMVEHPRRSADLISVYLKAVNIDQQILQDVVKIIQYHETGTAGYPGILPAISSEDAICDQLNCLSMVDSIDWFYGYMASTFDNTNLERFLEQVRFKYQRITDAGIREEVDKQVKSNRADEREDVYKLFLEVKDQGFDLHVEQADKGKVDLNTAADMPDREALRTLFARLPQYAAPQKQKALTKLVERVIAERANGPYASLKNLASRVKGLGASTVSLLTGHTILSAEDNRPLCDRLDPFGIFEYIKGKVDIEEIERLVKQRGMKVESKQPEECYGFGAFKVYIDDIFHKLDIKKGDTVLEIGPRVSVLSIIIAIMGAKVTVVDLSAESLARFRIVADMFAEEISLSEGELNIIEGDINDSSIKAQFGDSSFTHVICLDVVNQDPLDIDYVVQGIRDRAKQQELINTIVRVIKKDIGTLYFKHLSMIDEEYPYLIEQLEQNIGIRQRHRTYSVTYSREPSLADSAFIYKLGGRESGYDGTINDNTFTAGISFDAAERLKAEGKTLRALWFRLVGWAILTALRLYYAIWLTAPPEMDLENIAIAKVEEGRIHFHPAFIFILPILPISLFILTHEVLHKLFPEKSEMEICEMQVSFNIRMIFVRLWHVLREEHCLPWVRPEGVPVALMILVATTGLIFSLAVKTFILNYNLWPVVFVIVGRKPAEQAESRDRDEQSEKDASSDISDIAYGEDGVEKEILAHLPEYRNQVYS
ncbi:MAG: hypothetical protein ACYSR1_05495, partial [Planctomycetota bacterium]